MILWLRSNFCEESEKKLTFPDKKLASGVMIFYLCNGDSFTDKGDAASSSRMKTKGV